MASVWYRSKKFRFAAVLVGLLLVILLALPYLVSLDRYRVLAVEQLQAATGREVEIDTLRLHFLPSLHISVGGVRVKNPEGFPEGDTASVGSIEVGLAFWPLLRREVEIRSVEVNSVEANLLVNERGQTNYDFPQPQQPKEESQEASPLSLTQVGAVTLSDVRVSSGRFRSRRQQVYPDWAVSGINLDLRHLALNDPEWLSKLEADLDLSTIEISLAALTQPVRFTQGKVEVRENAAEGEFALALGSLTAEGTTKVADLGKPVADFTLVIEELNVAELSQLAATESKGPRSRRRGSRKLLARGTVTVARVLVPPYSAQNVRGQVRLYGDRLVVNPFTLGIYGGRTRGDLFVNLNNPSVPARVNLKAEGVDVARAMAAASPTAKDTITGTFETEGRLAFPLGRGDPLAGLSGQGTFAVRDGTFPGLNIEGTLAKLGKLMAVRVPEGDTRFSYFGGDFRIADQRLHSRRLDLHSESLEARLRGSFGFDQSLDYRGSGELKG
ncbi:MAG: AsmA family protein, partial [Terriglobia bacterium]